VQHDRLEEQRSTLSAKLAAFQGIELTASGMHAESISNWFRISHLASGRHFDVDSSQAADFAMPSFDELLMRFEQECGSKVDEAKA
jgi:hypothetical protein